jgi:hypothetical protein
MHQSGAQGPSLLHEQKWSPRKSRIDNQRRSIICITCPDPQWNQKKLTAQKTTIKTSLGSAPATLFQTILWGLLSDKFRNALGRAQGAARLFLPIMGFRPPSAPHDSLKFPEPINP